jgi:tRNA pseudouridine55 synthase
LLTLSAAINKPPSITSAQVVRDLQKAFNPSNLFAPWLELERSNRGRENKFQKGRRKDKRVQVKVGHGGTLDPLATGVLIIGVGKGTKSLQNFLSCTKAYEAVLLFGAATDTYDVQGRILGKAPYDHITREKVEDALDKFKGKIMQRPPIFSALRIQGKRLYEYAREGKEVPVEIQERPVTVENLEIMEWLAPGTHEYKWPSEEAPPDEQKEAEKVFHFDEDNGKAASPAPDQLSSPESAKRKRSAVELDKDVIVDTSPPSKRVNIAVDEPVMSGALPQSLVLSNSESNLKVNGDTSDLTPTPDTAQSTSSIPSPPAVKLRMTVTSGFYVRSLCHDLGKAVGSLGIMAKLVRTRQGDFELERNVLNYADLGKGEELWGPKVERMLAEWNEAEESSNGGRQGESSTERGGQSIMEGIEGKPDENEKGT